MASSTQTATSGVTWGRPSARTVEIQNSSASSSTRRVSCQSVGTASRSLNRVSSSVSGCFIRHDGRAHAACFVALLRLLVYPSQDCLGMADDPAVGELDRG